jgi:CheY-like chemotaxis protein
MTTKILLIDDDSDDRVLFREAIQEIAPDTTCVTESEGYKALADLFDSRPPLPDVIFLDINMPTISGWDCISKIKSHKKTKDIPVVMISTSCHSKDADNAARLGAICLVTKTGDYSDLKQSLTNVLKSLHDNDAPLIGRSGYAR